MAAGSNRVGNALAPLAEALLDDVEQIAARSVARMQELLPSYASVPADVLLPVTLTNTRRVIEAVIDPDFDARRSRDHFRASGEARIRQGISADEMLQAWRIGLEVVREEAHPVAARLGTGDDVLLAFVEATLQWGDIGMRVSASAVREGEIRELERLASEQAALRRVATLVAREVPPDELFTKVCEEVALLLDAEAALIQRYEQGGATVVGSWATPANPFLVEQMRVGPFRLGSRWDLEGDSCTALVHRTRKPARIDDYETADSAIAAGARALALRSTAAGPIIAVGRLWGAVVAATAREEPLPADAESRMAQFTELVAMAIGNAEVRAEVERLALEQSALRRVATLVAEGAPADAVFDAVAAEMKSVLGADTVTLGRYEPADEVIVVAQTGPDTPRVPTGARVSHPGRNVTTLVRRSERAARLVHRAPAQGSISEGAGHEGVRTAVGAPIVVDGRLWGVAVANWNGEEPPPADTEDRMARFAELLDTAVANADSRDQLIASRARLLTEADEARRRMTRDLHDGAQQRLVHTIITLKLAQRALSESSEQAEPLIAEALEHAQQGNAELRELAHGILPAVLISGGLRAGVGAVVARLELPVAVEVPRERFPPEIEASAYFIVAEGLTNVVKHARASSARVSVRSGDGALRLEVADDGIGGADADGHGIVGLRDRAGALGGHLVLDSPPGGGTTLAAILPLPATS